MSQESCVDLLHELGLLAFERFERLPDPPPAFREVDACFTEESQLTAEVENLETELNEEDQSYKDWVEHEKAERKRLVPLVRHWRAAIDGVKEHGEALRRELGVLQATLKRDQRILQATEARWRDLEMRLPDERKRIEDLREVVVKLRLRVLREKHQIEDLRVEVGRAIEARPGQRGAAGVRAYGELLQLDIERTRRRQEHADRMQRLEREIGRREQRLVMLEEVSNNVVTALGEECWTQRVPDPAFFELLQRLDALNALR